MKKKAFEIENKVSYDFCCFIEEGYYFLIFLRKKVSKTSRIIGLGCITGNNLKMLKLNEYKNFEGVNSNKIAID